ncbi:MAG TPA: extracellular solute-binding protein [Roseiflexaceae bacterium]|nr:extracellular solute-binding protein [Roseiflexaceae bacterium]
MPRLLKLFGALTLLALLLAACGGGASTAPTAAPAPAAAPTAAPAPAAAPTAAPAAEAPTAIAEPTAAPAAGGATAGPKITGEVTLWHAYGAGGAEETAINQLIDKAKADNPDAKITVLEVPFDQIFKKFETESATGGGPDMFIAPNDSLGSEVRAGLLMALDDQMKGHTDNLLPVAVDGCKVEGKLYCVPESLKAVALFYNSDKVKAAPKTTDELLAAVKGGMKIALNQNAYHNVPFFTGFGGKIVDDAGKCALDPAFGQAMAYLKDLKAAGAEFFTDGGKADDAFQTGKVDAIINGPWATGNYKKSLGDKVAVAPAPAGPKGPAGPLTGTDGFYINVNTKNVDGAVALGLYLTSPASEQVYVDVAGHVPADKTIHIKDAVTNGFATAAATGYPRPQVKELDNFWGNFGDAVSNVIEKGTDPAQASKDACAAMDKANGK